MKSIPKFLYVLFFVQLTERFGYYGIRALLALFLVSKLRIADSHAFALFSIFSALSFAMPVLGGFLSDAIFGARRMVFLGGTLSATGTLVLALSTNNQTLFLSGLGIVVLGAGFMKANVATLLDKCYAENSAEKVKGFTLLHVAANAGGTIAAILCGVGVHYYGWNIGFFIASLGSMISLVIFSCFKDMFKTHGASPHAHLLQRRFFGVSLYHALFLPFVMLGLLLGQVLVHVHHSINLFGYFLCCLAVFITVVFIKAKNKAKLGALLVLLLCVVFAAAISMQIGSLMTLFAERNLNKQIWGCNIPSVTLQSINPFAVAIIGFVLAFVKKHRSEKMQIGKVIFGMLLTVIGVLLLYIGCVFACDGMVGFGYYTSALVVIAWSELLVWPFVQAQVTRLSPPHLAGMMMGCSMFALALANLVGVYIGRLVHVDMNLVSPLQSLAVYQNGFRVLIIVMSSFILCISPFLYFVNKVIKQK